MLKIIIIGTLHVGLTPNKDLEEIFLNYKPTQILSEINQGDINNNNISEYPPEMIFAYKWATENKIKVNGFDSKIDVFKKGVTDRDNQNLIAKQKEIISNYSWRDFNQVEKEKLLNVGDITDQQKERDREIEMLNNINKVMVEQGVVLIITGCAHLNFFEENIKNAIFPFR